MNLQRGLKQAGETVAITTSRTELAIRHLRRRAEATRIMIANDVNSCFHLQQWNCHNLYSHSDERNGEVNESILRLKDKMPSRHWMKSTIL